MQLKRKDRQRGFSLLELLVFIIVVGLAAAAILGVFAPVLQGSPTNADILRRTYLAMERVELSYARGSTQDFASWCPQSTPLCQPLDNSIITAGSANCYADGDDANAYHCDISVQISQNSVNTTMVFTDISLSRDEP